MVCYRGFLQRNVIRKGETVNMKLSEMNEKTLKNWESELYYLKEDNPELADLTIEELHEKIGDELEKREKQTGEN